MKLRTTARRLGQGLALAGLIAAVSLGGSAPAQAQSMTRVYTVTITNLASGQLLSPPVVAVHGRDYSLFEVGEKASEGIWTVAEQGNPMKLAEQLRSTSAVESVVVADGPIHRAEGMGMGSMDPMHPMDGMKPEGSTTQSGSMTQPGMMNQPGMTGANGSTAPSDPMHPMGSENQMGAMNSMSSVTLRIESHGADRLSLAMMVGCTNDGFTGLSSVPLSNGMVPATYYAGAYDAGTEMNTQRWSDMPDGCNALGPVPKAADGMNARVLTDEAIQMHAGIVPGQGDLTDAFAWNDPIVKITIQRVE
jgi:hypothetical protein